MHLSTSREPSLVAFFGVLSALGASGCVWSGVGWDEYASIGTDETETGDDYEKTYFIAECTDYTVCPNTPINSVGFELEASMQASNWTGDFKLNSGVRLTQFIDDQLQPQIGQDSTGADSRTFAVYAGHANVGWIQVSHTDPTTQDCAMPLAGNLGLGAGAGGKAGVFAMVSSCSGYAVRGVDNIPIPAASCRASWRLG